MPARLSRQRGFLLNPARFASSTPVPLDLTTFTEVDPQFRIAFTSSRVTYLSVARNTTAYLYRDFGVNYFSGNVIVNFDFQFTSASANGAFTEVLSFANQIGDSVPASRTDTMGLVLYRDVAQLQILLREVDGGTAYFSPQNLTASTMYYARFVRDETVGTHGTIYLYLATSSANRNSGIWAHTLSITLHTSKKDYRYLYVAASYNDGASSASTAGFGENYVLT